MAGQVFPKALPQVHLDCTSIVSPACTYNTYMHRANFTSNAWDIEQSADAGYAGIVPDAQTTVDAEGFINEINFQSRKQRCTPLWPTWAAHSALNDELNAIIAHTNTWRKAARASQNVAYDTHQVQSKFKKMSNKNVRTTIEWVSSTG